MQDPFLLFDEWILLEKQLSNSPISMVLATVGEDGRPAARAVLLKGYDQDGFVFYTNTRSRKARELAKTPYAALCFLWPAHEHQVRVEGPVSLISDEEADAYFASRPRERQLGAWASLQSEELPSRKVLQQKYKEYEKKFEGKEIPRPPHWSGYRITANSMEFWIGHKDRLNERILFVRDEAGEWQKKLLYP